MSKYQNKVKNILKNLKIVFPDIKKMNYLELSKNLEQANVLFNKMKNIIISSKNNELEDKLNKFEDYNSNKIFDRKDIKKILELVPKFRKFHNKLEKNNKIFNKKQHGGGKLDLIDSFNKYKSQFKDKFKPYEKITTDIFNWIFFPLWSIEKIPYIGYFVEIQLDFIGILLDNLDLIMENISPVVEELKDTLFTIVGAIPGVGTGFSAVELVINILDDFIFYLMEEGLDIIGLIINVSRKEWNLALISLLEVIPELSSTLDALITNLTTLRKYTTKTNNKLDGVIHGISDWEPLISLVMEDTDKLFDLKELLKHPITKKHLEKYLQSIGKIPFIGNFIEKKLMTTT